MRSEAHKKTDFEVELERIDRDISELEEHALSDSRESQGLAARLEKLAELEASLAEK